MKSFRNSQCIDMIYVDFIFHYLNLEDGYSLLLYLKYYTFYLKMFKPLKDTLSQVTEPLISLKEWSQDGMQKRFHSKPLLLLLVFKISG